MKVIKPQIMDTDYDPLDKVLEPPLDETPEEREARLVSEKQAKQISLKIDEDLERQRAAERKGPKPIKILLLGECPFFNAMLCPVITTRWCRTKRVW